MVPTFESASLNLSEPFHLNVQPKFKFFSTRMPHSFDSANEEFVSCLAVSRPHTFTTPTTAATTSTSNGSSSCVVGDEVCGPISVGGWSKADDTVFIREVSHACALWERLHHQHPHHVTVKLEGPGQGGHASEGGDPKNEDPM